jgi:hypothetical protein
MMVIVGAMVTGMFMIMILRFSMGVVMGMQVDVLVGVTE